MGNNKTILITGASSGLGLGMAKEFARKGYNLALCARRLDRLESLKVELENLNSSITVGIRTLDVRNYDQVFDVFRAFKNDFGHLDRIIVNAGIGKGQPLGTGYFHANRETAETNFVAALAQCEAAMEIFREQNAGHLVMVSSMSAMRGLPKNINTYAATKAGVASLAEGLRMEMLNKPIKITTLFPGYILTEINADVDNAPFRVSAEEGCRQLVAAIEKEKANACVPAWPWAPIGFLMRTLPLKWVRKIT